MADSDNKQNLNSYLLDESDIEENLRKEEQLMNERHLRLFLLRRLTPEEHLWLEQRLFSDEKFSEALEMVEDELIEDYAANSLPEDEMNDFENNFIWTDQRRQKLWLVEKMKQHASDKKNRVSFRITFGEAWRTFWHFRNPALSWSLAAALFLIVAGGSWSLIRIAQLQRGSEGAVARQLIELREENSKLAVDLETERSRRIQLEEKIADLGGTDTPLAPSLLAGQLQSTFIALTLAPARIRDSQIGSSSSTPSNPKVTIPPGTDQIRLDLENAPQGYSRYQAVIEVVGGNEINRQIFQFPHDAMQEQTLPLKLSADMFAYEDYVLRLSGVTPDGIAEHTVEYFFRIRD